LEIGLDLSSRRKERTIEILLEMDRKSGGNLVFPFHPFSIE
jgi:hypothetical protein